MNPMAERVERILREKFDGNASAWSLAAKVARQQVTTFLDRAKNDPNRVMMPKTVQKLAAAAGCDFIWLNSGVGDPYGGELATVKDEVARMRRELDDLKRGRTVVPDAAPDPVTYEERVRRLPSARKASEQQIAEFLQQAAQGGMGKLSDQELDDLFAEGERKPSKRVANKADQSGLDEKPRGARKRG